MPMATEDARQGRPAIFAREPVGPKNAASTGSPGDQALMDALIIVGIAWVIVFMLSFSLRNHSI